MTDFKVKPKVKVRAKKNRLKADFTKEIGNKRKCDFCKSYMAYSQICAVGNKPDSKYMCYRFNIKVGKEKEYAEYLTSLKKNKK